MLKSFVCLSLVVILLSAVMGVATSCGEPDEPAKPVVLKLSTSLPPNLTAKIEEMAERFNQRAADSNYSIEVYPGGVLCTMEEALDMVRTGAVDISDIGLSPIVSQDARFGAVGIPFTLDDIEASARYVELISDSLFADIFEEEFNQMILSAYLSPFLDYCGLEPVKTLEDWEGLLVQTMNPIQSQIVEALGASAVSMPFVDIVPSLEKGVIDGGVNLNAYVISMMNWYDSFDYITVAGMFGGYCGLNINLDAFNTMPEDVQEILIEEGEWFEQAVTELILSENQMALEACANNGIEVYYLPETELNRWRDVCNSVIDAIYAQFDPDVVSIIQDTIAEANE